MADEEEQCPSPPDSAGGQLQLQPNSNSKSKLRKKVTPRPAMQIYKPPGLRSGSSALENGESVEDAQLTENKKPFAVAGSKQPDSSSEKKNGRPSLDDTSGDSQRAATTSPLDKKANATKETAQERPKTASPSLALKKAAVETAETTQQEAAVTVELAGDGNGNSSENLKPQNGESTAARVLGPMKRIENSPTPPSQRENVVKPANNNHTIITTTTISNNNNNNNNMTPMMSRKKKNVGANGLSVKEVADLKTALEQLEIGKESETVREFITDNFETPSLAVGAAAALAQFAIEGASNSTIITNSASVSKGVARACAVLLCSGNFSSELGNDNTVSATFHRSLVTTAWQYYECRDQLRADHFKYWVAFVNFTSDLYASVGFTYEGELVDVLFRVYDYLLTPPVLESLKIEELECLISSLLSVGYDLERQCPERLVELRETIRDALVGVQEPWARKMILLLMELSASGWKLPADANEYYFQQTSANC